MSKTTPHTCGARIKTYMQEDNLAPFHDVRFTDVIIDGDKCVSSHWKTVGVPVGGKRLKFSYILVPDNRHGHYKTYSHPTVRLECLYLNPSMLSPNEIQFEYIPSKFHLNIMAFILDEKMIIDAIRKEHPNDEFGIVDTFYEMRDLLDKAIERVDRDVLSVIYAHLFRMFDKFFGIDFRHFTRLNIKQVFKYIKDIHVKGVQHMFDENIFIEEFSCLKNVKSPITRKQDQKRLKDEDRYEKSTISSYVDDMEVELDDEDMDELYGDDASGAQKKVYLRIDFKKAHSIYTKEADKFRSGGGEIPEMMHEGDADAEERAFLKRKHEQIDDEKDDIMEEDGMDSLDYMKELRNQVVLAQTRWKDAAKDPAVDPEAVKYLKLFYDAELKKLNAKAKAMVLPQAIKEEIAARNKRKQLKKKFNIQLKLTEDQKKPITIVSTDYREIQFHGPSMIDLPYETWRLIWFKWFIVDKYVNGFDYYITTRDIKTAIEFHVERNTYHFNLSWANICPIIIDLIRSETIYVILCPMAENESWYYVVTAEDFAKKQDDLDFLGNIRFACAAAWNQEVTISRFVKRQLDSFDRKELLNIKIPDPNIWKDRPRILSEQQIRAIVTMLVSPLSIVHGKGGSGKSLVAEFAAFIAYDLVLAKVGSRLTGSQMVFEGFKNDTVNMWRETILESKLNTVEFQVTNPETGNVLNVRKIVEYREQKMRLVDCPITGRRIPKFVPGPISPDDDYLSREYGNAVFITMDHMYYANAKPDLGKNGVEQDGRTRPLDCKFLFLDETGMVSGKLMQGLAVAIKAFAPRSVVLIGDYRQLRPIGVGDPYPSLIDNVPYGCVQLAQNFRTKFENVVTALDQVLKGDQKFLYHFSDQISVHTHGLAKSAVPGIRSEKRVFKSYIEKFVTVLRRVDPKREKYEDVFAICPYNDYGMVMSMVMDHYYFGNHSEELSDLEIDIMIERALFTKKETKYAPTLYKNQRVVFVITDKEMGFHMGRVMYVTDILRHSSTATLDHIKRDRDHLASFSNTKNATADMQKDKSITFTIVLTGMSDTKKKPCDRKEYFVTAKYSSMQSVFGIIDIGSCISVTRSQGMSIKHVIGIIPEGVNLSNNRVLYVLVSRTMESINVIGEERAIMRMLTTVEKSKTTFLPMLLKSLFIDDESMDKIRTINQQIEDTMSMCMIPEDMDDDF